MIEVNSQSPHRYEDPEVALRIALSQLEQCLELEYARGRIRYEADLQHATVAYLNSVLGNNGEQWMFGTEHPVSGVRPDIVCLFAVKTIRTHLAI